MKYLNKEIIDISKKLGFELIGFCHIEYFKDLETILKLQETLNYKTPFQVGEIGKKTFKKDSIYKSAIVLGLTYNKINIKLKENEVHFSSVAVGTDYHKILNKKLKFISSYLEDKNYKTFIGVDNNIYDERYLAYKAGLGFYGKNGLLINDKYGSFFYIGVILTDASFNYNTPLDKSCLGCNKCVEVCPTKAINKTGILNGNKCLSYLTQKKNLTLEESKYINNCVYGCDICSNICPHNKDIPLSNNFKSDGVELIETDKFLKLSDEEYNYVYKNNSSYWRGKKIIDRNIKLEKENILK